MKKIAMIIGLVVLTVSAVSAQQFPPGVKPSVVVKLGQEIPERRINEWVMFVDNLGNYTGIRLYDTQNRPNIFNEIEIILVDISDGDNFTAELLAYHFNKGFILARKEGKYYVITYDGANFKDIESWLKYCKIQSYYKITFYETIEYLKPVFTYLRKVDTVCSFDARFM